MWGFEFLCTSCRKPLRSRGLYQNVRRVLELQDFYYLATEYMDCICGNSYPAWDSRMLEQLPYATRCTIDTIDSASWVTNVGNEYGAILQCVVTYSESNDTLQKMSDGITKRYEDANVPSPKLLYTDRDCCNTNGPSKYESLFSSWKDFVIRLDVWHFMRRIAVGCSSESYPLYDVFISQLSGCIFTTLSLQRVAN